MVKVYSIALVVGIIGLIWVILGGALVENVGRPDREPSRLLGVTGRSIVGGVCGFGMGGMAAEFSPLDLAWLPSLMLAVAGAFAGVVWIRYVARQAGS